MTVNLTTGQAQDNNGTPTDFGDDGLLESDTLISIENIIGTTSADNLSGDMFANTITGGGGDDFLFGGLGNDTFGYTGGNDTITDFDFNNEKIDLSATSIVIITDFATDFPSTDIVSDGGSGSTINLAGYGYGSITLPTVVPVNLTENNFIINQIINGSGAGDNLTGGDGNDTINGGGGNDILIGGDGSDLFQFNAGGGDDTIEDFAVWEDHVELLDGLTAGGGAYSTVNVGGDGGIDDTLVTLSDASTITLLDITITSDAELLI